MGGSNSKGVKNAIIGDEALATEIPNQDDPRWVKAGKISKLYVYPVKSLKAISVDSAQIEKHGLKNGDCMDRQFIVVDGKNQQVDGKRFPPIVLVQAEIKGDQIIFNAPGMEPFVQDIQKEGPLIDTEVIGQTCQGIYQGPEFGTWLGQYLDKPELTFKLLWHDYSLKKSSRQLWPSKNNLRPMTKQQDVPLFANFYGFLMINDDSVQAVDEVLKTMEIEHKRFRPNILVDETEGAFCEDNWLFVMLNGSVFRNACLCPRCPFITVDAQAGKRDEQMEPLKTMRTFRAALQPSVQAVHKNAPFLGLNLGIDNPGGIIHVKDDVFVIKKGNPNYLIPMMLMFNLPFVLSHFSP